MKCPKCEMSCSDCGSKIREEGKVETQIEEDFKKLLESACDVITFREGTELFETAKEVIEKLREKYQ